jgi:hypothetical protein
MTRRPWSSPRLQEDLQLQPIDGPADYAYSTDKPVEYVAVANEASGVIGYIWACDADDAAGWKKRPAAGDDAYNAGSYWIPRLRVAKAMDLTPSQALAKLLADPGNVRAGRLVRDSKAVAPSSQALREMADRA